MGKVIKLSENKFDKLFEVESPNVTTDYDDENDEYTEYDEFGRYINDWAEKNGLDIEKDGWFYKIYIGDSLQGQIIVDFNNDINPKSAHVFKMTMACDDIEENFQILRDYHKVLDALKNFNDRGTY